MSTARSKISVVMPTYNCGKILDRALSSVSWADEIIIVDMGSIDDTKNIAQKYNAIFLTKKVKDGNFDKNRKYGMEVASCDWILKLDSDEEITAELQKEIKEILNRSNDNVKGYFLKNIIFMFGQQVKHGFVKHDSKELRLVKNGYWKYDPYRFHQQITVKGKTKVSANYYIHYNYSSVSQFINKMNYYSSIDTIALSKNIDPSETRIILALFWTFTKFFVFQKGFLDGRLGFEVSFLYSLYYMIEKIKVYEFKKHESKHN